tara:strand:+ start:7 stop:675 length:669 start_codon:yes stop_codon:yes gene_type:complete
MTSFKSYILYYLRIIKNYYKILFNKDFNNLYLPNILVKNIIFINPNQINFINSIPMKFHKSTKLIINFDWDKKNENINDHETNDYKFIICRDFCEQTLLKENDSFLDEKKNIDKYKKLYDFKKNEPLSNYLRNKLRLFLSIKQKGLKNIFNNNIQFMIDRNLNLVKINSGDHRFAISRILKLKKIPIEIKLIHADCFQKNLDNKRLLSKVNELIRNVENKYN